MRLSPPVLATDIRVIDGSSALPAVRLEDGKVAILCRGCAAVMVLDRGDQGDARNMPHAHACVLGAALRETSTPVLIMARTSAEES